VERKGRIERSAWRRHEASLDTSSWTTSWNSLMGLFHVGSVWHRREVQPIPKCQDLGLLVHVGAGWHARCCSRTLQFELDCLEAIPGFDEPLGIVAPRGRDLIGIQQDDRVDC
jgi:hypothetical protein